MNDVPYLDNHEDDEEPSSPPMYRPILAAVDLAALILFAALRKADIAAGGGDLLALVKRIVPFVFSWIITSPISGVYAPPKRSDDIYSELFTAIKAWIVSFPLGFILRAMMDGNIPSLSTIVVTFFFTLIHLVGARVFFSMVDQTYEQIYDLPV